MIDSSPPDDRPLASVIVLNHNYGEFLARAVDSALAQTYRPLEVIVVDDGSTDDSRAVIAGYAGQVTAVLQANAGMAAAMNAGFAHSHGKAVAFLDADDFLLPTALEKSLPAFQREDVVKVHWPLREVDAAGNDLGRLRPAKPLVEGSWRDEFIRRGPIAVPQPPTSGNIWARWFLAQVMPLRGHDDKHGGEGFLRKLAPIYGTLCKLDEPQSCYCIHGRNFAGGRSQLFRLRRSLRRIPAYCRELSRHLARQGVDLDPQIWMGPDSEYAWLRKAVACYEDFDTWIPRGEAVLLIDQNAFGSRSLPEREVRLYCEQAGEYWGMPDDSRAAEHELQLALAAGVRSVAIAFPAFWCLDEYPKVRELLDASGQRVCQNERLMVWRMASQVRGVA